MNTEPINSLYLLAVAVIVFVLGYRFYSKLLALAVFRPPSKYSPPVDTQGADPATVVCRKPILFGHHTAAIAATSTITGAAIALFWGWVPAFLWLVVGTVVAAGTLGFGVFWLSSHYPKNDLATICNKLFGFRAYQAITAIVSIVLLIIGAGFIWLATELLQKYPTAVLAFWIQIPVALFLGRLWRRQGQENLTVVSIAALAIVVMMIGLLGNTGFAFSGALDISVSGSTLLTLDAGFIWAALLIAVLIYSTTQPVDMLMRPRAYLTALQAGLFLIFCVLGLLLTAPTITAPEFHSVKNSPGIMPWLFITLTSGAVAGFHALIASGVSARAMADATDARHLGYGGAIADGALAVSAVIIIGAVSFQDQLTWNQSYVSWDGLQDLTTVLTFFIDGFSKLTKVFGMNANFSQNLAVILLLGLLLATLDACLLLLKKNMQHIVTPIGAGGPRKNRMTLLVSVLLLALVVFFDGEGAGGRQFWPTWGIANHVLALIVFLILVFVADKKQSLLLPLLIPALFLLIVSTWAWAVLLPLWWTADNWIAFITGFLLLSAELVILTRALRRLKPIVLKYLSA